MSREDYKAIPWKNGLGMIVYFSPTFSLRSVKNEFGDEMPSPSIDLMVVDENGAFRPFDPIKLTAPTDVFLGEKDTMLVRPQSEFSSWFNIQSFIEKNGLGRKDFMYDHKGRLYPCYRFDEDFLRDVGGASYRLYEDAMDKYFEKRERESLRQPKGFELAEESMAGYEDEMEI